MAGGGELLKQRPRADEEQTRECVGALLVRQQRLERVQAVRAAGIAQAGEVTDEIVGKSRGAQRGQRVGRTGGVEEGSTCEMVGCPPL